MQKIQFSDMELSNEMQRAVEEMGFEEPTSIQAASIPRFFRQVVIVIANGHRKTAAFSIPAIEKINPAGGRKTQVLILCPTRELAVQRATKSENLQNTSHFKGGADLRRPTDREAVHRPARRRADRGGHAGARDGPYAARHAKA